MKKKENQYEVCKVTADQMKKKKDNQEVRKIQLVAREGMLSLLLDELNFPTEDHRKIIELVYEETVVEMGKLWLEAMA
jgi:hypothetical protein